LRRLGKRDVTNLLVEGGAEIHGGFFNDNLVDKVYFFFAPKIIGGKDATPMVGGIGVASVADAPALKHVRLRRMDGDIMVAGYLEHSPLIRDRKPGPSGR
jgi:diaminohydroxyphosphoribosylaminopyrimidine deaminase/5-amino-6-(5-phosphoribosylamino)uracil reductase